MPLVTDISARTRLASWLERLKRAARARIPPGSRAAKWITPWNILLLIIAIWSAPRLLPHLAAIAGVSTGHGIVPEYSVRTLDGNMVTADSLRGRVVLVNFWATWCTPCRVEMPLLQSMHERHSARGFVLLGFSVDRGDPETVRRFLSERGVTYPVAIVGGREQLSFGGVRGYPTSFLIDRTGVVRHAVIGPIAPATLALAVRRLLDEPVPTR